MKLFTLAAFAGLVTLTGSVSAQTITPTGQYVPAPQAGTVIMPATYTTPQMMNGTVIQPMSYAVPQTMGTTTYAMPQSMGTTTYVMPSTTYSTPYNGTGGMSGNQVQLFPSALPGSTVFNGTTTAVRNVGTTVVTGTRRTVRRGLGIFRR